MESQGMQQSYADLCDGLTGRLEVMGDHGYLYSHPKTVSDIQSRTKFETS